MMLLFFARLSPPCGRAPVTVSWSVTSGPLVVMALRSLAKDAGSHGSGADNLCHLTSLAGLCPRVDVHPTRRWTSRQAYTEKTAPRISRGHQRFRRFNHSSTHPDELLRNHPWTTQGPPFPTKGAHQLAKGVFPPHTRPAKARRLEQFWMVGPTRGGRPHVRPTRAHCEVDQAERVPPNTFSSRVPRLGLQ